MRRTALFLYALLWSFGLNADEYVAAYKEFTHALNIIEQTQLEIFSDETPPDANEVLAELDLRLIDEDDKNSQLETMRKTLSEAIDAYNDQYANYISPDALKRYREKRSGTYHGIGLKFRAQKDNFPLVIGSLSSGPLHNSSLQPGDQIIAADEVSLKGKSSSDIVRLLKGPEGTTVKLSLKRNDHTYRVDAKRGPVSLEYARSDIVDGNIAYIKISRFGGNTHTRVRDLVTELLQQDIHGFIVDLRDNPGGSTRAARSITSIFVKEDHIYCERYKSGKRRLLPRHGEHLTDLPLTILVNGNSMSASEIVAGALQAYQRGTVIGEPTFGKGLVQKVFDLSPPLGGAIRTTIAEFATPKNQAIHATGIVPDRFVRTEADFMFRQTGSLNISKQARNYQRILLEERVRKDYPDKAEAYINAPDAQLNKAIEVIRQQRI